MGWLVLLALLGSPAATPAAWSDGDPQPPAPAVAGDLPTAERTAVTAIDLPNGCFFVPAGATAGYAIVDEPDGPPFWMAYQRLGGFAALGAPVSRPFSLADGRVYQATEQALLVWQPGARHAELANLLDLMSAAGLDDWLWEQGIPYPEPTGSESEAAGALDRLGWLVEPAIRDAYFARPSGGTGASLEALPAAIARFGLPASWPELFQGHVTQRFQRGVLRLLLAPGDRADDPVLAGPPTVVSLPAGELLRRSGRLAPAALVPDQVAGGRLISRAPRPQLNWPLLSPAGATPASTAAPAAHGAPAPTAGPATPAPAATVQPAASAAVVVRAVINQGRAEHVVIANVGSVPQDLGGWTLRSASGRQSYTFPAGFVLAPGATVNVHSGAGDPATLNHPPSDLFATRANVWSNAGDVAQLLDAAGRLVSEYRYGAP